MNALLLQRAWHLFWYNHTHVEPQNVIPLTGHYVYGSSCYDYAVSRLRFPSPRTRAAATLCWVRFGVLLRLVETYEWYLSSNPRLTARVLDIR